jgi:hypothetical protein
MAARCMVWLLGGALLPREPAHVIASLATRGGDAREAEEQISRAARAAFGPRRYVHLDMPA